MPALVQGYNNKGWDCIDNPKLFKYDYFKFNWKLLELLSFDNILIISHNKGHKEPII